LVDDFLLKEAKVPDRGRNRSLKLGRETRLGVLKSGVRFSSSHSIVSMRTRLGLMVRCWVSGLPRFTQDCSRVRDSGVPRPTGVDTTVFKSGEDSCVISSVPSSVCPPA